jgi:hypothetical protein
MNAAVAHGPQNLSVAIINKVFYKIWHSTVYGELRGRLRVKAQIHDSILYGFKGAEVPQIVCNMMTHAIDVKDCFGKTRSMLIPPDISAGQTYWADLK